METCGTKTSRNAVVSPLFPTTLHFREVQRETAFRRQLPVPGTKVFTLVFVAVWVLEVLSTAGEYALDHLSQETCVAHMTVLGVMAVVSLVIWTTGKLVNRGELICWLALFLWASLCYAFQDERFSSRVTAEEFSGSMVSCIVPLALLHQQLADVLQQRFLLHLSCGLASVLVVGSLQAAGRRPSAGVAEALLYLLLVLLSSGQTYRSERRLRLAFTVAKEDTDTWGFAEDAVSTEVEALLKKLRDLYSNLSTTAALCSGHLQDRLTSAMYGTAELARDLGALPRSDCTTAGLVSKAVDSEYRQLLEDRFHPRLSSAKKPRPRPVQYGSEELQPMLKQLEKNWNFDMFFLAQVSGARPLEITGEYCLRKYALVAELKLDEGKVLKFLQGLERKYQDNPYHNSTHAADVLNSLLFLYRQSAIFKDTTELELFGSIIAALGHDVGHPALSNRYLANSRSNLAMLCKC